MFEIHLGIPEMEELWNRLEKKHQSGSATKTEENLRRQMGKALVLLSGNPRHPGLHSHEITSLTARYGQKVWESYLDPGAETCPLDTGGGSEVREVLKALEATGLPPSQAGPKDPEEVNLGRHGLGPSPVRLG